MREVIGCGAENGSLGCGRVGLREGVKSRADGCGGRDSDMWGMVSDGNGHTCEGLVLGVARSGRSGGVKSKGGVLSLV